MEFEELKHKLIAEAKSLESYLIDARRHIHMYPEIRFEEEKTAEYIEKELKTMGYETQRSSKTGVIAILEGAKEGKTIALRADIDALNLTEENDVPYKSKNIGKMHACGHDVHTASLLTAARIIKKYRDNLTGKVKFIFQPAEEGGGGALKIIEDGHLDDVDAIFGLHVWQELPSGIIGSRKGPILASSDEFTITIKGKGGHAASPHQTFDPTSVLVDIYNAIQKIVSREINPIEHVVITSPVFKGSDAFNIIPPEALLKGTFRTFNNEVRDYIVKRITEIAEGYSRAWRCECSVEFDKIHYPPTVNDPQTTENAMKRLETIGPVAEVDLSSGGEDFSFYQERTKGVFIALGLYNEEKGIIHPHHHPKFDVDEETIWKGAAIYSILAFYGTYSMD